MSKTRLKLTDDDVAILTEVQNRIIQLKRQLVIEVALMRNYMITHKLDPVRSYRFVRQPNGSVNAVEVDAADMVVSENGGTPERG